MKHMSCSSFFLVKFERHFAFQIRSSGICPNLTETFSKGSLFCGFEPFLRERNNYKRIHCTRFLARRRPSIIYWNEVFPLVPGIGDCSEQPTAMVVVPGTRKKTASVESVASQNIVKLCELINGQPWMQDWPRHAKRFRPVALNAWVFLPLLLPDLLYGFWSLAQVGREPGYKRRISFWFIFMRPSSYQSTKVGSVCGHLNAIWFIHLDGHFPMAWNRFWTVQARSCLLDACKWLIWDGLRSSSISQNQYRKQQQQPTKRTMKIIFEYCSSKAPKSTMHSTANSASRKQIRIFTNFFFFFLKRENFSFKQNPQKCLFSPKQN